MTSHGSAAKSARERKEKHPELYCPVGRCLWRTGGGRCPKHPASIAVELAEMEARDPKLRALGERIENFGRSIAAAQSTKPTGAARLPLKGERVEYRAGFASPVYLGTATGERCSDGEACTAVHVLTDGFDPPVVHHIPADYFATGDAHARWARVVPAEAPPRQSKGE